MWRTARAQGIAASAVFLCCDPIRVMNSSRHVDLFRPIRLYIALLA